MTPGKLCSQAGHAYLGAYIQALQSDPSLAADYSADHPDSPGTKICLQGNLAEIVRAQEKAKELGIPHFLVIDSGCENFFNGQPIITALGIGPAKRADIKAITKRLKLVS